MYKLDAKHHKNLKMTFQTWYNLSMMFICGFYYVKCNNVSIRYVSIRESVILSCYDRSNSKTTSWRRGKDYLFRGYEVNQDIFDNKRFTIVSSEQNKDYNLKISNVTEKDYGKYTCESQSENGLIRTEYSLTVRDATDNATQGNHPSTTADIKQSTASLYDDRKSTEQNKDDSGMHGKAETALSSREIFYFGLFAAGLVLVLCVSVICNSCINRKCKNGIGKTYESTPNDIEDKLENSDLMKSDEITSPYDEINEDEMVPQSVIALRTNIKTAFFNSRPKSSVDLLKRSCFEITSPNLNTVHQSDTDKSKKTRSIPNLFLNAEHIPKSSHCFRAKNDNTTPVLKVSSETDSFKDEDCSHNRPTDDGYLHPYVALNTNEMDHLHSYSTPNLLLTVSTTACVDSSVQVVFTDDYLDAFSAKR